MTEPFISKCCGGERCGFKGCSVQAEHKVEETIFFDDPLPQRHPLTSYLCHHHFMAIMGPAADRAPGRPGARGPGEG